MLTERRGQQNLALTTDIPAARCSSIKGQIDSTSQEGLFRNRWVRISLRAQNKETVFNNLLTHICVDSLKEAFKAVDGNKALGVDSISKMKFTDLNN